MTRSPDPKSKTINIQIHGKPGEAEKIRAFKEICARNGIEMRDVVLKAVDHFLREHHWPPGNSQTLLNEEPPKKQCWRCKNMFLKLTKVRFISGKEASTCAGCIQWAKEHNTFVKELRPV